MNELFIPKIIDKIFPTQMFYDYMISFEESIEQMKKINNWFEDYLNEEIK